MTLYDKVYDLFHQWLNTTDEDFEEFCEWISNQDAIISQENPSSDSQLKQKLKKLSFFTHYPKKHATLTINNVTEEYPSKKEMWVEWLKDRNVLIFTFTGTTLKQYNSGSFSGTNMTIDYGDGTIEATTGKFGHTYSQSGTYTVKIYGVTSLNKSCFDSCTGLTSILIPDTVTSLGQYCFFNCTSLTLIAIPNSITSIQNYSLYGCNNLSSMILNWTTSNQIITYNQSWFGGSNTSKLNFKIPAGTKSLYTAKGYSSAKIVEPVEFIFTGTTLTQSSNGSFSGTNMTIDYGDGTIEATTGKFGHTYSQSGTYTVKIYGVTSLKASCFNGCTGLTSIILSNNVTSIGGMCFWGCTNLTNIIIPDSITAIGTACFNGCSKLTEIILAWDTSSEIVTYNSNWIVGTNSNLKFRIPNGTTSLYTAKGYPSAKLVEI